MAFGVDDALLWSTIIGGAGKLGQAAGLFKDPQAQEEKNRRDAQRKYLEANLPDFNYQKQAFNPADYADVLNPMQERLRSQGQGIANAQALRGSARGGVSQELALNAQRAGNQDINQTMASMARSADDSAFQRALAAYNAKLAKTQALSQLQ